MGEDQIVILIIISVTVMILLALSLIIFFNFSQKKILNEKVKNQEQKLTFQKEMLENTIRTQEEERSRIAKDLHDEISSKLNIIHLNMHMLRKKVDNDSLSSILKNIDQSLKASIDRSRKISHELMPPVLQKFGLKTAIEELSKEIKQATEIKFILEGIEHAEGLSQEKQLHLYRIIQEWCNNTLKYAHASEILLEVKKENSHLIISYQDNGQGIQDKNFSKGMGMLNIASRVQILGGKMEIPPIERGVLFVITLPIHNDENDSIS